MVLKTVYVDAEKNRMELYPNLNGELCIRLENLENGMSSYISLDREDIQHLIHIVEFYDTMMT